MTGTQHYLVASTDTEQNKFTTYTCKSGKVVKEEHTFKAPWNFCINSEELLSSQEAITNAEKEIEQGAVWTNSVTFVTKMKTGKTQSLNEQCLFAPVLTKVPISDLKDVKEGDHIMTGIQHFLVANIDTAQRTYTGYTCRNKIVVKEVHRLNTQSYNIRIEYEESLDSKEAIENAEAEKEHGLGGWSDSDKFVTKMKTGRKYTFNDGCLFKEEIEFSRTKIVPGIAVDEGDHLMVKDENGNFQSVLVLKHAGGSTFIVTPDLNSETLERYGKLDIENNTDIYRINYQQSLRLDATFQRAMSERGFEILTQCRNRSELSKFVSWTKIGKQEHIDVLQLKSQIAQLCPFQREKILSVDEIQVGDHLIRSYPTHWWHFMVTEVNPSDSFKFKTIYCYRSHISETEETLDPSNNDIYRIIYPESLPVPTAIERARSKLGTFNFSPHARMWFVRWAKTGSEDGIEVDFLLNNVVPASKSSISTFAQLNPGDYLVEEEDKVTPWHHYLVTEVTSPSSCSAIESWNWRVIVRNLTFNKNNTYYRLNYNHSACISPEQVIATAQKLVGKRIITPAQYKYKRQKLVNYLKTHNATEVIVDSLQNDRVLLHRQRVESALDLRPGDHIERPFVLNAFHHMMITELPHDDKKCKVIHFQEKEELDSLTLQKKGSKTMCIKENEVDIFVNGDNVFLLKYPERLQPDLGIKYLRQCIEVILSSFLLRFDLYVSELIIALCNIIYKLEVNKGLEPRQKYQNL